MTAAALAHGELDDACIQLIFLAPRRRFGRRIDRGQIDDASFRFGNDFVFDDENIAGCKCNLVLPQ